MQQKVTLAELSPMMMELLNSGGTVSFVSNGISMYPMLKNAGQKVYLKKLSRVPKKDDVIFYRRENGQFVLHRIIGKDRRGFILRGDNQIAKEYGIRPEQILATLIAYEPLGGAKRELGGLGYWCYVRTLPLRVFVRRLKLRIKRLGREMLHEKKDS